MGNKKEGAVEWLESEMLKPNLSMKDIFNQAKEMEKEQIIETWNTRAKIDGIITFTDNRTAEQYYKETYGE